jgi:iron-sulfur cluster assembly accessory protein
MLRPFMQEMAPIVQFTPSAKMKLVEVLKEQNAVDRYLRIYVFTSGGCACSEGYSYSMSLEEKPRPDDVVEEVDSIKVVTDKSFSGILRGSRIDYLDTLQRRGFKLENPNVKSGGCGCGGH